MNRSSGIVGGHDPQGSSVAPAGEQSPHGPRNEPSQAASKVSGSNSSRGSSTALLMAAGGSAPRSMSVSLVPPRTAGQPPSASDLVHGGSGGSRPSSPSPSSSSLVVSPTSSTVASGSGSGSGLGAAVSGPYTRSKEHQPVRLSILEAVASIGRIRSTTVRVRPSIQYTLAVVVHGCTPYTIVRGHADFEALLVRLNDRFPDTRLVLPSKGTLLRLLTSSAVDPRHLEQMQQFVDELVLSHRIVDSDALAFFLDPEACAYLSLVNPELECTAKVKGEPQWCVVKRLALHTFVAIRQSGFVPHRSYPLEQAGVVMKAPDTIQIRCVDHSDISLRFSSTATADEWFASLFRSSMGSRAGVLSREFQSLFEVTLTPTAAEVAAAPSASATATATVTASTAGAPVVAPIQPVRWAAAVKGSPPGSVGSSPRIGARPGAAEAATQLAPLSSPGGHRRNTARESGLWAPVVELAESPRMDSKRLVDASSADTFSGPTMSRRMTTAAPVGPHRGDSAFVLSRQDLARGGDGVDDGGATSWLARESLLQRRQNPGFSDFLRASGMFELAQVLQEGNRTENLDDYIRQQYLTGVEGSVDGGADGAAFADFDDGDEDELLGVPELNECGGTSASKRRSAVFRVDDMAM
jgi:hypothetical protein